MGEERRKLVERVQKLLALAESPNQYEAELAAQRASELMEKYQIGQAEAALTDAKKIDVDATYYDVPGLRMKYAWVVRLTWAAARLFDCEIIDGATLHGTRVMFVGYPDDIEMAKTTFEHLYRSWNSFVLHDLKRAKVEVKTFGRSFTPRDTMKYKLGHGQGYAMALFNRANKLAQTRKEKVQKSGATGTALVVAKDIGVKNKMAGMGLRRGNRSERRGDSGGHNDGFRAGRSVALGGSIQGGGSKQLTGG